MLRSMSIHQMDNGKIVKSNFVTTRNPRFLHSLTLDRIGACKTTLRL